MAVVLVVAVEVHETNETGGNNVLLRSNKSSSVMVDDGIGAEGTWILAQKLLEEHVNAVGDDALAQMKVAERNAKQMEARGEL